MPKITKEEAAPLRSNGTPKRGLASRIVDVSEVRTGLKFSVYGRGKTGKTRLACSFPKPLLLLGTEDGTKTVSKTPGVQFVRIQHSAELEEAVAVLEQGKYKTVVLDHGSGLQDMILKEVLGLADLPVQRSWGMAERGDWMTTGSQWKERVRKLLDLADRGDFNTVIIAHERNFTSDEGAGSDVMLPSVGSALSPTVAAWLNGACDYVCQCYIRQGEETFEQKVNNQVVKLKRPTGKAEYCLRVGPHAIYMTGFRLPDGTPLPEFVVDPNYEKIMSLIQGKPLK